MSRKKIRIISYVSAVILGLGLYAFAGAGRLADFRTGESNASRRAFEETVHAAGELSTALKRGSYATDPELCAKICAEIYARADSAQSAMSVLPFTTVEMENLSGFLGTMGDYAYSLCGGEFTDEQRQQLGELAEKAAALTKSLTGLQQRLNDGELTMDSRERRLRNVGEETGGSYVSTAFSDQDRGMELSTLRYDGRYGAGEKNPEEEAPEYETRRIAAEFLGVSPDDLTLEYEYSGGGRRCYSLDSVFLCAFGDGRISMTDSRLVPEALLDEEEAKAAAEEFLNEMGLEGLELQRAENQGTVECLRYVCTESGAKCLGREVHLDIALDDGSVHAFDSSRLEGAETADLNWTISEEQAAEALPETLRANQTRRGVFETAGGRKLSCYELSCSDEEGTRVTVYVDASSGQQLEIELEA